MKDRQFVRRDVRSVQTQGGRLGLNNAAFMDPISMLRRDRIITPIMASQKSGRHMKFSPTIES